MTTTKITLRVGLSLAGVFQKEVVIRAATAGDIIDGTMDAERVVITPDGPALVSSPSAVGANVLRRRIVSIGSITGPFDMDQIRELQADDLGAIQKACDNMDKALGREAAKLLEKTGRDAGAGTAG